MGFFNNLFCSKPSHDVQHKIEQIVSDYKNPLDNTLEDTKSPSGFLSAKSLSNLTLKRKTLTFTLTLPYPCKSLWPSIEQSLAHELMQLEEIQSVSITFKTVIVAHDAQKGISPPA